MSGADGVDLLGRLAEGVRGAGRWVRRFPDRALHPLRRRRARRALAGTTPAGAVLFVCHGNICRSPYAEAALRRRARGRLEAASAGLVGPGRPSPETAVRVAAGRGVDLADHRSRLVTGASLRRAGLVVVMEPRQRRVLRRRHGFGEAVVLGDLDPGPVRRRPIRDPIFRSPGVFRSVYARIDRCTAGMLDAMDLPVGGGTDAGDRGNETARNDEDGAGGRGRDMAPEDHRTTGTVEET